MKNFKTEILFTNFKIEKFKKIKPKKLIDKNSKKKQEKCAPATERQTDTPTLVFAIFPSDMKCTLLKFSINEI